MFLATRTTANVIFAVFLAAVFVSSGMAACDHDFDDDAGLILSNGTRSHCARILSVSGNTVTFSPGTPTGFSMPTTNSLAAPAVIYEISGASLFRNNVLLASNVDDPRLHIALGEGFQGR